MSWQEDLHRLEHDLAMGRLSAEDYRRQRDELLAAANAGQSPAAGPTPQAAPMAPGQNPMTPGGGIPNPSTPGGGFPNPGTPGGGIPGQVPGQPPTGTPPGGMPGQQAGTPFPPAFKWSAQPPNSERTQTMRPVGQEGGSGEATQVVGGGMDQRTQAVRPGDPDRTQVVHNNPFGGPQPQQSPWPGGDQSNLYSSDNNMPNWNTQGAFGDWPKQGPEVFEKSGNGGGGRRVLLIVLIVVVLAGLGVGGWLLFGNKGSQTAGNTPITTTHAPTPTTTPGPRPAIGLLVNPPGFPSSQAFTPTQLQTVKPLPKPDLDLLTNTSLANADYVVSNDGSTTLDLWAFQVADNGAALALAKSFDTDETRFGFTQTDITIGNGQYVAYTSQQQSNGKTVTAYRLHYVVGNQVVRVEAFDADPTRARSEFVKLLNLQKKLSPPSNG